jgi:hypothetical protein
VTPTALYVPRLSYTEELALRHPAVWQQPAPPNDKPELSHEEPVPAAAARWAEQRVPAGLRAMAVAADGRVDDGWFGGFGPVPSACSHGALSPGR